MQLIANITLMFTELPFLDRFAAAARAGFVGVEIQFPYEWTVADIRRSAGDMPIVLINVPASDDRGGNGRATDATARGAFAAGLEQAARYASELGVSKVNVLGGPPPIGQHDGTTARVFSDNVALAAKRFERIGVETMLEVINPFDAPGFWLEKEFLLHTPSRALVPHVTLAIRNYQSPGVQQHGRAYREVGLRLGLPDGQAQDPLQGAAGIVGSAEHTPAITQLPAQPGPQCLRRRTLPRSKP